jgi:anaerobic selenocysteine-containing dehydrogenase
LIRVKLICQITACQASHHLKLRPSTNVALVNALAYVIVTENLVDEEFVKARCDVASFEKWRKFVAQEHHSPEAAEACYRRSSAEKEPRHVFMRPRKTARFTTV